MNMISKIAIGACAATFLSIAAANAAGMLTAQNGMTLYTFDKDTDGVSACYDACATNWPAYAAKADDKMGDGWSQVKRKDGTLQWAYHNKPVYFFAADKAKGDKLGDGKGNVWHVIAE